MSSFGVILAIDHGDKRTGFAVVDALRLAPKPLEVFSGQGDGPELLDHIVRLSDDREIGAIIVGWPVNMDGSRGARTKVVKAFIARLKVRFPSLPIVAHDERLTSHSADSLLRDSGKFGKERKSRLDSWSALVLLQDWLAAGEPMNDVTGKDASDLR